MTRLLSITGTNSVLRAFKKLKAKAEKDNTSAVTGYTANYAIYVHEDLEAHHETGQAKFLEQPAQQLSSELAKTAVSIYGKTGNMEQALLVPLLRLQRVSQRLVPVDTGALRASAFTAMEDQADEAAIAAYLKATKIRQANKGNKK